MSQGFILQLMEDSVLIIKSFLSISGKSPTRSLTVVNEETGKMTRQKLQVDLCKIYSVNPTFFAWKRCPTAQAYFLIVNLH